MRLGGNTVDLSSSTQGGDAQAGNTFFDARGGQDVLERASLDGGVDAEGIAVKEGWLVGASVAGADFGEQNLPGQYGTDYMYPGPPEIDYLMNKGMNLMRIPFRWERIQHEAKGNLDAQEVTRLDAVIQHVIGRGGYALLDMHNYARYYGDVVGSAAVSDDDFADVWVKIMQPYKNQPRVIIGLMGEPHSMPTEQWLSAANTAIAELRRAGITNLIMIPGNQWTGAHAWTKSYYGTPNSQVMKQVVDPEDNFVFEVHQYLDGDYSGRNENCQSETIGREQLVEFTQWLQQNGYRGYLGEFAGGNNPTCRAAVTNMLNYINDNRDVWLGWAWWGSGGGPWDDCPSWWEPYRFNLRPPCQKNGSVVTRNGDRPQMAWLEPYLSN